MYMVAFDAWKAHAASIYSSWRMYDISHDLTCVVAVINGGYRQQGWRCQRSAQKGGLDFELTRSTRWRPIGVRRERRDREAPTTWLLATPIRKTEC